MHDKENSPIPVGLLSGNSEVFVSSLTQSFPESYRVSHISLDQLTLFASGSKLGLLNKIDALVVDGLDEDLQVFRLAYLIKRTYPKVKLILVCNDTTLTRPSKSHFDGRISINNFSAEIGSTLEKLRVGKDDITSKLLNAFRRIGQQRHILCS